MTVTSPNNALLSPGVSLPRRAALLCAVALVASVFVLTPSAGAAPGDLDTSFGAGTGEPPGAVMTAFTGGNAFGEAVALQPDGKIVVGGTANNGTDDDFAVARYNADGTLDTTFGTGGKVVTPLSTPAGPWDVGADVAIQPDKKIVLVGTTSPAEQTDPDAPTAAVFGVVRYNANGSLDTGFGTGGITTISFGSGFAGAEAVVVDRGTNKIVIAGSALNNLNDQEVAIARLEPGGGLDGTFDTDGKQTTGTPGTNYAALDLVLQPDGKIVTVGSAGSPSQFYLVRYLDNGSLDTAFDMDGKVITPIDGASLGTGDIANAVALDDDKIVVAGGSYNGTDNDVALARYNGTNGSLDTTFAGDGTLRQPLGAGNDDASGVAIQPDGRIVAAGGTEAPGPSFSVSRYTPAGQLDNTFGGDGIVTAAVGPNGLSRATDIVVQPDGKLVVSGFAQGGAGGEFAVARYLGLPAPGYWLVAADGGIFSFGSSPFFGSTGSVKLNKPVVGMTSTPTGKGYWFVAADGGIFNYGDAQFFGSTGSIKLNQPVVGMAATPTGKGYWLVASDGGIFSFGDAEFFGSTGSVKLNQPVAGMAATPTGQGYWFVAADGGIFSFGDAKFFGSTGSVKLNQPVVGMAPTTRGKGYWFVASDGGIFSFGDAEFFGSTGSVKLNKPVVGMSNTPSGKGYWFVASDGGVFSFGDADFVGSTGSVTLNQPVVGMEALGG